MALRYQQELDFMIAVLRRMRLSVHLLHPEDTLTVLDAGMRGILGMQTDYEAVSQAAYSWSHERTIYKVLDHFMCNYIYFHLPEAPEPTAVIIGPYLTMDPSRELLLEQAERLGIPMDQLPRQEEFYASLPVFSDPTAILALLTCFAENVWGASGFDMLDTNYDNSRFHPALSTGERPSEEDSILQQMKQMEERYAYENELMEIVSKGLIHRAEVMMSSVSHLNYQHRLSDPLRNIKNYCIICNTLLRKAAQNGGVHPLYLDRLSSQYARQIENATTPTSANSLIGDMIRGYCRLVRTHTGASHSGTVQKALAYIDANLSGDLSLNTLARLMQVSPGYLSTLFHRETGRTLAKHIITLRMKTALHLLKDTHLQVQTIAQLIGFNDPNYFGKQFRRFFGVTPLGYRKDPLILPAQFDA